MKKRGPLPLVLALGTILTVAFALTTYKSYLNSELVLAVAHRNYAQVNALLRHGANPNTSVLYAQWEVEIGDRAADSLDEPDFRRRFLDKWNDLTLPSRRCQPLLQQAASDADPRIALALIDHGAEVNAEQTYVRLSPLSIACCHENLRVVQRLLQAGAKINRRDAADTYPVTASLCGRLDNTPGSGSEADRRAILRLLLQFGADLQVRDRNGFTILEYYRAQGGKRDEAVNLLVRHGAIRPTTVRPLPHRID